MGIHKKEPGVTAIMMLKDFGEILGYSVTLEELMFPGDPRSPELDLTWRQNPHVGFPLFIFEVESVCAKAASDNALKVFARKTPTFEKPLYFFHIFLDDAVGAGRVDYLKDNYDKLNYGTYLLSTRTDSFNLIKDILEQHLRLNPTFDLYSVINLLQLQKVTKVPIVDIFDLLLHRDYDRVEGADFLLTLESLIVCRNEVVVRDYYLNYLDRYLADKKRAPQKYPHSVSEAYSSVIHYGLALLLNPALNKNVVFEKLRAIEDGFQPWPLWAPYFGLSQDHDLVLLSEFPIILTLLVAAFSPSSHAVYFSQKLVQILSEIRNFTHYNIHGLVWLLIASRIAGDREGFEFARSIINLNGGVPIVSITAPSAFVSHTSDEKLDPTKNVKDIPSFEEWVVWLRPHLPKLHDDLLVSLLDAFFVMNDPEQGRTSFATYSLQKSLRPWEDAP